MEFIVGTKENVQVEVLLKYNKESYPEFHSIEMHNGYIKKYGKCHLCNIGSKCIHSSLIQEK